MKIAMFTILSPDFMIGFKVFMKSFLHYNKWFKLDFIILDIGLSSADKKICKRIYPKCIFRKPNYKAYEKVNFNNTHPKLQNTFYFLDAFCQYDYDKIVSVDVDMVVLDTLEPVFKDSSDGISACRGYNKKKDRFVPLANAGLFVVGKKHLNEGEYLGLLNVATAGYSMPEQKTMNIYYDGRIDWLPKRYNIEKRMYGTEKHQDILNDAAIIHYVGLKPWQDHSRCTPNEYGYEVLEKIWIDWSKK